MKQFFIGILCCLTFCTAGRSQSTFITGRIIDKNRAPVEDACVMVYSRDSTLLSSGFSDSSGRFRIEADSARSDRVRISRLGYETVWKSLPTVGDIELAEDGRLLSEVVVKGKRNFARQTSTGFVYDLSGIDFVKDQNLFEALRLVPFVDIDREGTIRVKGDTRYKLYLNGKPFDMGMANPVQILQSIPAKKIKKIEIVTEPDLRFHNNDVAVVNIITSQDALDGIYVNGSAKYGTQPNAKAGASVLAKKKRVDFSFSYDYDYKGQRDQPISQSVTTDDGSAVLDGKGDGDWHTHILRALASWRVDSLNAVYADFHAKINHDDFATDWMERNADRTGNVTESSERNRNSQTEGTLEANVIYRNYFRHDSSLEHFMVGYRYTYNPDKRHNMVTDMSGGQAPTSQKTNGGLNEHTLDLSMTVPFSRRHQLSLGARTVYRNADVRSTDGTGLSYTQSITYPYLNYTGSLKWLNIFAGVQCEYEYLSMHDSYYDDTADRVTRDFYVLPYVDVYRPFGRWNVNLMYSRNLKRPSVVMLNPFYNSVSSCFRQTGNPDLKAETADRVTLGASWFKSRVNLSLGVTYTHTGNAILNCQKESEGGDGVLLTYDNIGKLNTLTGNVFVNWQPITPLVIKFNINGGLYDLKSEDLALSQTDYTLNVFGWADYYFPHDWNLGANVMHFKQAPEPFGTVNSITFYSVHVGKTWLKGALSASLEIANPIEKYAKLKTAVNRPAFSTRQVNYMTARYVGLSVSYTFQHGQKSKLKRDSSLTNSDQDSGVQ